MESSAVCRTAVRKGSMVRLLKNMKISTILVLVPALFFLRPLAAEGFTLNLTRQCDSGGENCVGRQWFLQRGFEPAYFSLKSFEGWKQLNSFPLRVKEVLPTEGSIATFTYITFFDLPSDFLRGNDQPGISLGNIGEVFEIFINGHFIAADGAARDGQVTYHRTVRGQVYEINSAFLKPTNNQLLIIIRGDPHYRFTGLNVTEGYYIGRYRDLVYANQDRIGLILIALYFFVGLYHLLLFWKRRREKYNLYFAIFCLGLSDYLFSRTFVIYELPVDVLTLQRIDNTTLFIIGPSFLFFLGYLFFDRVTKPALAYTVFNLLLVPFVLTLSAEISQGIIVRIWMASVVLFFIPYVFILIAQAMKKRHPDAKRMFIGTIVFYSAAIFDILDAVVLRTGITMSKYGFSFYILGVAAILANRFLRLHSEVEELNTSLELKVEKRTELLQRTLEEVRSLKSQQDGDYFLTSLLINPLNGNFSRNEKISAEVFTRQKKKFRFKKWESEIGGDLCVVDNITLRSQPYVVFMNADAMGKSIQGAGGSIVCGTIFKSILARTKQTISASEKFPEQWLKFCLLELQNVFVSFDGTMMASAVIGLVAEKTGMLYFISAEHPPMVIYRNHQARFVDATERSIQKLGMGVGDTWIHIKTKRLCPGDVLIAGSDGRDDIALSIAPDGSRTINEDEDLFLRAVEKGNGEISAIVSILMKKGEIIDDLSLLRIGFLEDGPVTEAEPDGKTRLREDALDLLQKGQWAMAGELWEEYIRLTPEDAEGLYYLSYSLKKTGERKKIRSAIDYGECCFLREPYLIKNINNLADCYRMMNIPNRARWLLAQAIGLDPSNDRSLNLLSRLESETTGV